MQQLVMGGSCPANHLGWPSMSDFMGMKERRNSGEGGMNWARERVMALACAGKWIWRMVTKRFWFSKNNAFHWLKPQLLLMQLLIILPLIPSFLVCMIQTYVNTSNGASLRWEQCCVKKTRLMGAGDWSWKPFCPWDPLCILKQLLERGVRYLSLVAPRRQDWGKWCCFLSCNVLSYKTWSQWPVFFLVKCSVCEKAAESGVLWVVFKHMP